MSNLCLLPLLFYERKMFQGARGLALYAGIAQRNGLVPIIGNQILCTLQKHNTENCRPQVQFQIHVYVSDLYIPTIRLPILLQENMGTDPGTL
jgi:hypothetical protein